MFKCISRIRIALFLIFSVLALMLMMILYGFSSQNAKTSAVNSNKISDKVVEVIAPTYEKPKEVVKDDLYLVINRFVRKTGHFAVYSLLGILVYFAAGSLKHLPSRTVAPMFVSIPVCVLFAISDETHQTFVEGRSGRVQDVFIDAAGVILGTLISIAIIRLYVYIKNRNEEKQKAGHVSD